jgi:hypothetical protein
VRRIGVPFDVRESVSSMKSYGAGPSDYLVDYQDDLVRIAAVIRTADAAVTATDVRLLASDTQLVAIFVFANYLAKSSYSCDHQAGAIGRFDGECAAVRPRRAAWPEGAFLPR